MTEYRRMTNASGYHMGDSREPLAVKLKTWEKVVYNSIFHFFLLLTLCAIIGIGLPVLWGQVWKPMIDYSLESDLRYQCMPVLNTWNVSKDTCQTGDDVCLWDPLTDARLIRCYYAQETSNDIERTKGHGKLPRYTVNESIHEHGDKDGPVQQINLDLLVAPPFLNSSNSDLIKGPVVQKRLIVDICHFSPRHFSVQIRPSDEAKDLWNKHLGFKYPDPKDRKGNETTDCTGGKESLAEISFATDEKNTGLNANIFQLQIKRKTTGKLIFDMGPHTPFIFARGYMEITTMLINDYIYGLGESYSERFRHNFSQPRSWTLFSQFNDKELNANSSSMWGSHPFYLGADDPKNGDAYGVLLVNSHPIQIAINARPSLSFRTFGGHFEFHFFLSPNGPAGVLKEYQKFIGLPAMPPYWALGFHVCSASCSILSPSLSQRLINQSIPVESDCGTSLRQTGDRRSFEIFQDQRLRETGVRSLNQQRKLWSVEPPQRSIARQKSNWAKTSLRYGNKDKPFEGTVPRCDAQNLLTEDSVTYPDFFNPETRLEYQSSEEFLPFADGYILEWNSPLNSAILNGSIGCRLLIENYDWNSEHFANLTRQTLCLDSRLSDGSFATKLADDHKAHKPLMGDYFALANMYGYKHAEMVYQIKKELSKDKRPLVLSLSTFVGSGKFGGHLGTHINSTWEAMRVTLKQTLDFGLFGIPMSGFPVGGFRGPRPTDELLRRWFQLAATQPIMFAHTDFGTAPRVLTETSSSVRESIRTAVQSRYRLLPYLYTQFWKASTEGELVIRPLFIDFDHDVGAYAVNDQYMLGPSLMVSPALNESDTSLSVYFPKGQVWYEYFSGHIESKAFGGFRDISAVEQNAPLHIRGGHVVVTHAKVATSIDEMRRTSGFQVIAALDKKEVDGEKKAEDNKEAEGDFYLDDGITDIHTEVRNLKVHFKFNYTSVEIKMVNTNQFCEDLSFNKKGVINTVITSIKMYGVIDKPAVNTVDHKTVAMLYKNNQFKDPFKKISTVTYQNNFGVLNFDVELNLCDAETYFMNWEYPDWKQ